MLLTIRIIYSAYVWSMAIGSFAVARIGASIASLYRPLSPWFFQTAGHIWGRFVIFIMGVRAEVRGKENIPRDIPVIFACNHQSIFDVILLQALIPVRFRFVVSTELFRLPLYGWTFKKAGYIPLERKTPLSAYKTLGKTLDVLRSGERVLVFPEGTRSRTGELGEFKGGSLLPAQRSGVLVIPLAISGSFGLLPPGTPLVSRRPVRLSIGKPVHIRPEDDLNKKTEEIRNAIAGMLA